MSVTDRTADNSFAPRIGRSVSIDHAAELLGVSRRTIYNRIRDGRLQTVRTLGGSQRVTLESVGDLAGRRIVSPSEKMDKPHKETAGVGAMVVLAFLLIGASVAPAVAQGAAGGARLSEDLADHLAHGSQSIDVIVDGTAQDVAALARKYNLTVKKLLR